jgi:hypothetical protein
VPPRIDDDPIKMTTRTITVGDSKELAATSMASVDLRTRFTSKWKRQASHTYIFILLQVFLTLFFIWFMSYLSLFTRFVTSTLQGLTFKHLYLSWEILDNLTANTFAGDPLETPEHPYYSGNSLVWPQGARTFVGAFSTHDASALKTVDLPHIYERHL